MTLMLKRKLGYLLDILNLLPTGDKSKILILGILQFVISLLDLIGILLIGIVTSLGLTDARSWKSALRETNYLLVTF